MLSWLTGAKGPEDSTIPHCDSFIEAPETPAPVFAVRAFKHAIFGTPKPLDIQDQDRFDDIAATMKPPLASQAKSGANAASTTQSRDAIKTTAQPDAFGLSPSKPNGILMTPGTTRRNKTVTFGAQVVDNEGKKANRTGLPNTCPGKFPSPWTPKTDVTGLSEASTGSQKRTKLTQTLHDVRDSSRSGTTPITSVKGAVKSKDDLDITLDFMEPRSQSGRYWKQEYDGYAEKTQREVKRLLMKQKSAKDFAKAKDAELSDLSEKLRLETRKAEALEARTKELEREMGELKKRLERENNIGSSDDPTSTQNEAARLRVENWKLREDLGRAQNKTAGAQSSPRRRLAASAKADIWADAVLSSPFVVDAASPEQAATPKKDPSPLTSRDINTLQTSPRRSHSKQRDRLVDRTPKQSSKNPTPQSRHESQMLLEDTLEMSLALPEPSPEPVHRLPPQTTTRTPRSSRRAAAGKSIDDLLDRYSPSKSILMTSPPPEFDRMALPIGMPSSEPSAQRQTHRKKPSLKESFAKAASPHVEKAPANSQEIAHQDSGDAKLKNAEEATEKGRAKKQLSEDRKRAALERIAARKLRASNAA